MTSPQDPNQPGQPGDAAPQGQPPQAPAWGAPPDPNQPGWGAPPPAGQPGWGAPPPGAQPGWGPPPGQPQPGWGAPPPGAVPGWGQPQPGWGPPPKKGHGCLYAFLIVVGLLVLVAGCTAIVAGPFIATDIKLYQDLGTDRVSSISLNTTNGNTTWLIYLRAGHDSPTEARLLACTIVGPDLAGTQFKNDHFQLLDSSGNLVAGDLTSCP